VIPILASSGNTARHRLNRSDDHAPHMVTVSKMTRDTETRAFVENTKTNRDIGRWLTRYIARRVFRILNAQQKGLQPA